MQHTNPNLQHTDTSKSILMPTFVIYVLSSTLAFAKRQGLIAKPRYLAQFYTLAKHPTTMHSSMSMKVLGTLFILGFFLSIQAQDTIYVSKNGSDTNTGERWPEAFLTIQKALQVADSLDQIWVAEGTYYPDEGGGQIDNDRSAAFIMKSGVALYGGFVGEESDSFNLADRNLELRQSILSGDIERDGLLDAENSIHVILNNNNGLDSTAILDGFVIVGGNSDGTGPFPSNLGGGMYNGFVSPTISNCRFEGNIAGRGGGICNNDASPIIINCTFKDNESLVEGAGLINLFDSDAIIDNCVFSNNTAGSRGGGLENQGNAIITNCLFVGNTAGLGGAVSNFDGAATFINCTFGANEASNVGGAMVNLGDATPSIQNCIIWDNTADGLKTTTSASIFNNTDFGAPIPAIKNSLVVNSGGSGAWNSLIGTDMGSNVDFDPLYISASTQNLQLQSCSPAIDLGDNSLNNATLDVNGNPRFFDSGTIDLGAYEFQGLPSTANAIVYVDASKTGGQNDGSSWADAFLNLQDGLIAASCSSVAQVWVAKGTYYADEGAGNVNDDREASFTLQNNLAIYGGFAGNEADTYDLSLRDFTLNETILSGEIQQDGDSTNNSFHVIFNNLTEINSIDNTSILDGFTITQGNANGTTFPVNSGAAMLNRFASPTISNCLFKKNTASLRGGAIFNYFCTSTLTNCTFEDNASGDDGGAIYNSLSTQNINNCIFRDNTAAGYGGGVFNTSFSSTTLNNCAFQFNTAGIQGGGIFNISGECKMINCTFNLNVVGDKGGALGNLFSTIDIENSIIWNNKADGVSSSVAASIFNDNSDVRVVYSLIANAGGSSNWNPLAGDINNQFFNLDTDPFFKNPANGDVSLVDCSPAIDEGDKFFQPLSEDLAGNDRIFNDVEVDMGAFEFQAVPIPSSTIMYVDASKTGGLNDGSSWADAYLNLQDALDNTPTCAQIWVAKGTYYPDEGANQTDNLRTSAFAMNPNVAIYGGFAGNEPNTYDLDLRDFVINETILSGDLDQNDGSNDRTSNSYHVIDNSANNLSSSAILDGFTISDGNADGMNALESDGGGMLNVGSSPLVINCIFKDNRANQGAGVFNSSTDPKFTDCRWEDNIATTSGGALHNDLSDPDFTNCIFANNQSNQNGGGITNIEMASPTFTNCGFVNNQAILDGGGLYNKNGATPLLLNTSFAENTAGNEGGAIYNDIDVQVEIANSLIWNNFANSDNTTTSASIFSDATSTTTVEFSSVQNSGGSINWNTDIGIDGGANEEEDPLFTDLANGNVTLSDFSPAIDMGDSSRISVDFDIAKNPRIDCANVDLGAYEVPIMPFMGDIIYVDLSKTMGANDGTSWSNAFISLQDALRINCGTFTQVWVAKGTYYPDEGAGQMDNNRSSSFKMKNGLAIHGSFVGNEAPNFDLSTRDFELNETILSGDIDQNDNIQDGTGNSYHILFNYNTGLDSTAILDGFTISNANTDGERFDGIGGGILNFNASPTIRNCIFKANKSSSGSGMYNIFNSSPTIDNCIFEENKADFLGGAIFNNSQSSPIVSNSFFQNNKAERGGGAITNMNSSLPTFVNCVIYDNAAAEGGAMYNAILSNPEIINASIAANKATEDGGALYSELGASPTIINSIIWGNEVNGETDSTSASIFLFDRTGSNPSNPQISYSLIAASVGSGSDWASEIGTDNGDNFDVDPLFLDEDNGDLNVGAGSYAINNGENTANSTTLDAAGEDRFVGTIDLGAYEAKPISISVQAFLEGPYVSQSTSMTTQLATKNLLPITEPFTDLGYTFINGGGETVRDTSIFTANDIVDWIFVELRSGADNQEVVATRAALLKSNGDIVELDGQSPLRFLDPGLNAYFVLVQHRSHLGVMSDNTLVPVADVLPSIDFTDPVTPTFSTGSPAQKDIAGKTVLISGDADQNGVVNSDDINNEWFVQNGQPYDYFTSIADFNLDGEVNAVDYNLYLLINLLSIAQIP